MLPLCRAITVGQVARFAPIRIKGASACQTLGLISLLLSTMTNHAKKSLAGQDDDDEAARAQPADRRGDGTHSNVEVMQRRSLLVRPLRNESLICGAFYAEIATLLQRLVVLKNET